MTHPTAELKGHDGYLSACRFMDDNNIITASGDSSAIMWDISRLQTKLTFTEHAADCLSVAVHPQGNSFATGSADCTAKLWDVRCGRSTHTFTGHESDINSIGYFPDGHALVTASTDSTCKIFDTRCCGVLASFGWDATGSPQASPAFVLAEHEGNVSTVGINATGNALCTGSADRTLKVGSAYSARRLRYCLVINCFILLKLILSLPISADLVVTSLKENHSLRNMYLRVD
ncbi:GNB3 [Symbiodinium microadriaticum]|nr:GNB3 [Symbiodinium microadriaticum]